jgi:Flp pilus assembly protein TadD
LQAQRLLARSLESDLGIAARAQSELTRLETSRADLDPACWPLLLDEARLLTARDNRNEAVDALREALSLNPRGAEALFMLGRLHLRVFNFEGARLSAASLREIQSDHVLAELIDVEAALVQQRWSDADERLEDLRQRVPHMPLLQALSVATAALQGHHDGARDEAAVALRDRPGDPLVAATTGRLLSLHRHYEQAGEWLRTAMQIAPTDHAVCAELGLMQWQAGLDDDARQSLQKAVALNPFDRRAANSLRLLEDMDSWTQEQQGNVIVRWEGGVDDVFAQGLATEVALLQARLERQLDWTPSQPTRLEVHGDHERFAVRVTGLPDVHTVAACTGPVIAMEPPRSGAPGVHAGPFNWRSVLQHELAHVAHLDLSNARVPLWFTEGAAVAGEPVPLDWNDRVMLAEQWRHGTLLPFEDINWSFVRPRRPEDRSLAYAQSAWFMKHLEANWGRTFVADVLRALANGHSMDQAFIISTGDDPQTLWVDFLDQQVPRDLNGWGLLDIVPHEADTADTAVLLQLLEADPDNAALLDLTLRQLINADAGDQPVEQLLQRLAELRPLCPWPREQLAALHGAAGQWSQAADMLAQFAHARSAQPELLDRLAMANRSAGRIESALEAMRVAVELDPYDVARRERAAAMAIEAGRLDLAQTHIKAMLLLEPNEPLHHRRLRAIESQLQATSER